MIIGVGIDSIEVDRVLEKIDKEGGFREQIFSPREIEFCESKPLRGEHYAARFAAKEAFLKATGLGLMLGHRLAEIEVVNDSNGKPLLNLEGAIKIAADENQWNRIHLSLTHLKNIATAIVIIEA